MSDNGEKHESQELVTVDTATSAHEHRVERVERFQSLVPGSYWKLVDIAALNTKLRCDGLMEGKVHLLKQLKLADNQIHSVVVLAHPSYDNPSTTYTILVNDFLNAFEFEPDAEKVREEEIAAVQGLITHKQEEITRISADPSYVMGLLANPDAEDEELSGENDSLDLEAGLPSSNAKDMTLVETLGKDVETLNKQINNQRIIAEAQANLLTSKTNELQSTIHALTPYYTERGVAAKAAASDAISMVKKVEEGLMTLNLYTGDGVQLIQHYEGKGADLDEPLSLRQRLLYMDEESLINAAEGGADFEDLDAFMELLATDPELLQRVIPEKRAVVAIQYRRRAKNYDSDDIFSNAIKNKCNEEAFLLIRDGENLYTVHSTLTYMHRLFPSKDDTGAPFKGYDGEQITIDDIRYADAKEASAEITLHYKRVLILLWGLYDREDVFGRFAAEEKRGGHVNLLSGEVQKEFFHFIYDDEPDMMIGEKRPGFRDWVQMHNAFLQSGSRVACHWSSLFNPYTAPTCVKEDPNGYHDEYRYMPRAKSGTEIAYRMEDTLYIKTLVESHSVRFERKPFHAQISLDPDLVEGSFSYLCLDNVDPEEVDWYINNRQLRASYLNYIPLLVSVRDQLREEKQALNDFTTALSDAMVAGGLVEQVDKHTIEAIHDTIRLWRAANRGKAIPSPDDKDYQKSLNSVMTQLWWVGHADLSKRIKDAEALCEREGMEPLRLSLTGKGKVVLYATTPTQDREERLWGHIWVNRIVLALRKTKLAIERQKMVQMKSFIPSERELFTWDEEQVEKWCDHHPVPLRCENVSRAFEATQAGRDFLYQLATAPDMDVFDQLLVSAARYNHEYNLNKTRDRLVQLQTITIPLGVVKLRAKENSAQRYGIILMRTKVQRLINWFGDEAIRQKVIDWCEDRYANPETHVNEYQHMKHLFVEYSVVKLDDRAVETFRDAPYYLREFPVKTRFTSTNIYASEHCLSTLRETLASDSTQMTRFHFGTPRPERINDPAVTYIDWFSDEEEFTLDEALSVRKWDE